MVTTGIIVAPSQTPLVFLANRSIILIEFVGALAEFIACNEAELQLPQVTGLTVLW